ncbi:MAG: type II secretion system F family protein [Anaerolineaceae bacterium]|nr:type II secretion system F family protein [Anaerolineaceae bacterium]
MDVTTILTIGAVASVLMLIVGIIVSVRSSRSDVEQRLGDIVEQRTDEDIEEIQRIKTTPVTDWINTRVEGSSFGEKISKSLARADVKMKPGEYIALMIIASFALGVLTWFIGNQNIFVGLIGLIIGPFLPRFYVNNQQNKRLIKFDEQLGDMLNLMVNGLRAGYSTMQAMEAVSKELPPPISDEFFRVVQEMQLGIPMERSLDNLLRRIPSDDLDLVITAINVQREVGGNLAEILDTISYTIRERVRIKGEIRVLTAQVMYSGRFLSMLPVFVIAILYLINREYIMEFFSPTAGICGYIALGLAASLIVGGYFAMNKLGDIEV